MAYDSLIRALLEDQSNELLLSPAYTTGVGLRKSLGSLADYKLKPWEAVLAGALTGLAGGALEGIGRSTAESRNEAVTSKLLSALGSSGPDRLSALEGDPETSKYATLLKLQEVADKQALELGLSEYEQKQKLQQALEMQHPKYDITELGAGGRNKQVNAINPYTLEATPLGSPVPIDSPNPGGFGAQPANQEFVQGLVSKGLIDSDVARNIRTNNDVDDALRSMGLEGVANRAKETKEIAERTVSLPGYVQEDKSYKLTPDEAKELRTKIRTNANIIDKLDVLANQKNLNALTGQDSQTQAALSADLFNKFRMLTNSGAALSPRESSLIDQMLPQVAAGNLSGALKAGLLGRDQKQFAQDLKGILQRSLDTELGALGFDRKESASYKLQSTTPTTDIKQAPSGMSFEQFQAWKRGNK